MDTLDNEKIKAHLRTLYRGQQDLFVWLRDVASSLENVVQPVRDSELILPPNIRTSLDDLDASLSRAQVGDIALQVIQSYLDGELADKRTI